MHVGMLAFILPVPVLYHVLTIIWFLVVAVAGAAIALCIVNKEAMQRIDTGIAGVCLGDAIVSMLRRHGRDALGHHAPL
jgi:NO-binding membrane sensor protein with MHYT domain